MLFRSHELNRETQLHGLAVTGGAISTTGIAGLTLGGGLGWLMTKLGLAADNLLSVELVTADGRVLTVSADEHPDLPDAAFPVSDMSETTLEAYTTFIRAFRADNRLRWQRLFVGEILAKLKHARPRYAVA